MKQRQSCVVVFGLVLAVFLGFGAPAGAEPRCDERPSDPNGANRCAERAYSGPFSRDEALRLCAGARNEAPAHCAVKAYRGPYTKDESIALCAQATTNDGPIDCAATLFRGPFSREEALRACRRDGDLARAECVVKAYRGPYTKEEAIELCSANSLLVLRSLKLIESSPTLMGRIHRFKASSEFDLLLGQ